MWYLKSFILVAIVATALTIPSKAKSDSFDVYMERCKDHRAVVESILEEEGLSADYFALLLAESGCKLENRSNKGAKGPWQLMDFTARTYGVEDPYDLEQSTRGAARYLKSLEKRFHTMEWVIAAYNAGGTNLKRVTGYPNANFSIVKDRRPEAYFLAKKVKYFIKRVNKHDKERAKIQDSIIAHKNREQETHGL